MHAKMHARKKRTRNFWLSGGVGAGAVLILICLLTLFSIAAKPAKDTLPSDAYRPLLAGGIAHTQTVEVAQTYVTAWDYVNIHVKNVVTGSQTLTIVPMFSNETGVDCSGVSDWYTATNYQILESETTTDTLVEISLAHTFTIVGSDQTARSVPVTGRCFQIKLTLSTADTYTPTYWLRLYNWDN